MSQSRQSVQSDSMALEEDDALLFLIYQHLKVNGYKKAAKVLEKHVTQVGNVLWIFTFKPWLIVQPSWLRLILLIFVNVANIYDFYCYLLS